MNLAVRFTRLSSTIWPPILTNWEWLVCMENEQLAGNSWVVLIVGARAGKFPLTIGSEEEP
jgi:hypothetical protein